MKSRIALLGLALLIVGCSLLQGAEPFNPTPLVKPVVYRIEKIDVPAPDLGWYDYYAVITKDEAKTLAALYDGYENEKIATYDLIRISHMLRLIGAGGNRDEGLEQLFYYTVFRVPGEHPVKAFLLKKKAWKFTPLQVGTKEYIDFNEKMSQVAVQYGID